MEGAVAVVATAADPPQGIELTKLRDVDDEDEDDDDDDERTFVLRREERNAEAVCEEAEVVQDSIVAVVDIVVVAVAVGVGNSGDDIPSADTPNQQKTVNIVERRWNCIVNNLKMR